MRWKTVLCSVVFIMLTVVKFAVPSAAVEIKQQLTPMLERNFDYRDAAEKVGKYISDPAQVKAVVLGLLQDTADGEIEAEAFPANPEDLSRPATILYYRQQYLSHALEGGPVVIITPEDIKAAEEAKLAQQEREREKAEAVEAFSQAQSAYASDAPANVSYDMPDIDFEYCLPVSGTFSSGFGYRIHPISGVLKFHYGLDIGSSQGNDITAFADGTVTLATEDSSYGKYVIIDHGNGFSTLYAHCSSLSVSAGQEVHMGDKIASVGQTGAATGPHLHFEIHYNDQYINPSYYVTYA